MIFPLRYVTIVRCLDATAEKIKSDFCISFFFRWKLSIGLFIRLDVVFVVVVRFASASAWAQTKCISINYMFMRCWAINCGESATLNLIKTVSSTCGHPWTELRNWHLWYLIDHFVASFFNLCMLFISHHKDVLAWLFFSLSRSLSLYCIWYSCYAPEIFSILDV